MDHLLEILEPGLEAVRVLHLAGGGEDHELPPGRVLALEGEVIGVEAQPEAVANAERNAALGGIMQALLLTKHMLFLGFSLDDDNFHRLFDAVRKAQPEGLASGLGTSPTSLMRSGRFAVGMVRRLPRARDTWAFVFGYLG